jgi:hypothetical protein
VNLATAIYCVSCRGILPAIPVARGVMGTVRKRKTRPPWVRVLGRIAVSLVFLALFLCIGLAVWPQQEGDEPPRSSLAGEPDLAILFSRPGASGTKALLGHQIGHSLMKSASDPLLSSVSVRLGEGTLMVRSAYSWNGISWTVSTLYRLEGDSGQWRLVPDLGAVGHLPVGARLSGFLGSYQLSRNPAVSRILSSVSAFPFLEISGNALRF